MSKQALKDEVLEAIDGLASEIVKIGDAIWRCPELGFKEFKTSRLVESKYEEYGWPYERCISITGSKAYIGKREGGPIIGIIGELDAVRCPDHPECDPITGAVHACGHHAQIASMLGAGMGLYECGALTRLEGNVAMLAVPAEEFLEIEYRNTLREKGEIAFFGGKQEFIRLGALDDIDISLGTHSISDPEFKGKLGVGGSNNGFIGKLVRYKGLEAHAGAEPHRGVNALNAALLGLMGIHAQRETFRDEDSIRVHPIITKGGEIVNNVPADVRIEAYVRGRTVEAIMDANMKVNRALKAGASAVGATVEISDIPGYMPYTQEPSLVELMKKNGELVVGEGCVEARGHSTGSTDLGDVSCVMPTASLGMGGVEGAGHTRSFKIVDKELLYVIPAKVLALTCIDLLYDGAREAKRIIDSFKPKIPKNNYTQFMIQLFR
ncbi:MAG: amidohydrolase [Candidatus Bathyarchaeia archaeon]